MLYCQVNATSNSITTVELSDGLSKNGKYITYGDSYEFDRSTGTYTIVNADGSPIQTIKYNEGYNNILVDKYIVNYGGSNSSTPDNAIGRSTIYKVTNNSTNLTIAYKTLEKSSLMTATESTLSVTPDDYGVSYYYRGDIDDNYVNFAGLCWRIVRIEGDGSVKLILEDKTRTCNHSSFTGNWADSTKINFGYDSTVTPNKPEFLNFSGGLADKLKTYQTTLNTKIANTYSNKGLSDYLKIDEWCYDDKINISEYIDSYLHEYYGAFYRITRQIKTSLKCSGTKLKKFSDNTDMYVGSLTADESVFAGGHFRTQAYYLVNNYQRSNSGFSFWTLSPGVVNYQYNSNYVYAVKSNGGVDELSYSTKVYYRPAITLKSGTTFVAGGVGTKSNPYVIN